MSLINRREKLFLLIFALVMFCLGYFYPPSKPSISSDPNITVPLCSKLYASDVHAFRACVTAFALQHNWYPSPIAGLFSYPVWNGFDGFWQDGAALETLANFMNYGNNTMYKSVLVASKRDLYSLLEAYGPQPSYDDMGWYAMSYLRIHEVLGTEDEPGPYSFLGEAFQIYNWIWDNGWDHYQTCKGGIWFDQNLESKQTVENAQMLFIAAKLYHLTKNESLIGQMEQLWDFMDGNRLINNVSFLISDGVSTNCSSNNVYGPSYNAGLMISALLESGDVLNKSEDFVEKAHRIAQACIQNLTREATFTEYCTPDCDDDAILFKGIFVRNLRYLLDYMDSHPAADNQNLSVYYREFLFNNSDIAWTFDRCEPATENCDVLYKDGHSLSDGTVGPVFDINYQGPYTNSSPISQTAVLDLFISSINPNTKCVGTGCGFDPPIPSPHPLTCKDNPCPQDQPCCSYDEYYTCCESTQKCLNGYCV